LAILQTVRLGIGMQGEARYCFLLIASLAIWYRSLGTVIVDSVSSPKAESFFDMIDDM